MSSDGMVSIQADISEVSDSLRKTLVKTPRVVKKMTSTAVIGGKSFVKKNTYSNLRKDTGELKKAYAGRTRQGKGGDAYGYIVNRAGHAPTQEFGNVMLPKKGGMMTFQMDDGQWVSLERYVVPAKGFFFNTLDRYYRSTEPQRRMETVLMKELVKVWG